MSKSALPKRCFAKKFFDTCYEIHKRNQKNLNYDAMEKRDWEKNKLNKDTYKNELVEQAASMTCSLWNKTLVLSKLIV